MSRAKAPFKVIYSNDTTTILTCTSPYHEKGETFRPEMLEATVDEVAGTNVDVNFIQLAHGWVPWYQSKVYPIEEHHRWWHEHYGVDPMGDDPMNANPFHKYLVDGGDMLQVFVDRCRATDQTPFVSLRMNDAHHLLFADEPGNTKGIHAISRFYVEHPEYRLGPGARFPLLQNWAIPEVRDYKFALMKEQCENYDIDGFEMDFMRFECLFDPDKTTFEERKQIVIGFVRRVRELLDRTARGGKHRWLCVRIHSMIAGLDSLGFDLPAMVDAGVEMINVSPSYFTDQQTDFAAIRDMVPDASVYLEMCHTSVLGKRLAGYGDVATFRRMTDEQFYTAAHLAYARGGDGMSLFNFHYFREHGVPGRGPFDEPPFHVLNHLNDPAWLARQPQHYMLAGTWCSKYRQENKMPVEIKQGDSTSFSLDMAPPEGGWTKGGRFRIQSEQDLGDTNWKAVLNGMKLEETDDRSEPYNNPYPPLLGTPEQHRAWVVPADIPKDGTNSIEITLEAGEPAKIIFLSLDLQ